MKKILVITTGGTIAMKKDRETGGLMPAALRKDLGPPLCRDWRIMLTWTCWNFPISPADG